MKWKLLGVFIVLTLFASVVTACASVPSAPKATFSGSLIFGQQNTGVWITGEGKVSVTPDVAILSLGIEAQETSVAGAQEQATTAMTAVVNELTKRNIAAKDIRTQQFTIVPVRRWVEKERREELIGYRVTNMVTVKIRKIAETGAIIDAAAKAGGDLTRINSIRFTVDDPTPYQVEARKKAMADAENKARQLAELSGIKLGKPTYINESGGFIPPPEYLPRPMPAPPMVAAETPISPGETEIRLTIQVVYSID